MNRLDQLAANYGRQVALPWTHTASGAQRTILVVYEKEQERALRERIGAFEQATEDAGHRWLRFDLTSAFANWLAAEPYRDAYFKKPAALRPRLDRGFVEPLCDRLSATLKAAGPDTAVALTGVASLYGFTQVSAVLHRVQGDVTGRLVVFFPGRRDGDTYRLLDARDGWNYLAPCVTADAIQPGR